VNKNLIFLYLLIFSFSELFPQTSEQLNAPIGYLSKSLIIPPSPEASNLGQYGNVPVSLYTGKINLSVPLYDLKARETSLPISLSYNSGGFRLDEGSAPVGLGWALNAGGVITRSAAGRPDNCDNFYDHQAEIYQNTATMTEIEKQDFYLNIEKGYIETEPDIFSYNIGGLSGSFYINADRSIVLKEYQPIKIQLQNNLCDNTLSFTITGPDGTKYYFEDNEVTHLIYDESQATSELDSYTYNSSWYLTKIVSANYHDTILFEYADIANKPVFSNFLTSSSMSVTIHGPTMPDGTGATPQMGNISGPSYAASASVNVDKKSLRRITWNNTEIIFEKSLASTVLGEEKLNSLTVNVDGVLLKKYNFSYSYFDKPSEDHDKRLRLDQIAILSSAGEVSPPYRFEYNTTALPSYYSTGIDHWGYYNGSDNSSGLIPDMHIGEYIYGTGADREAQEDYSMASILKKVTYPTGGSTVFEYEGHLKGTVPEKKDIVEEVKQELVSLSVGFGSELPCNEAGELQNYQAPEFQTSVISVPADTGQPNRIEFIAPGVTYDDQRHDDGDRMFVGIFKKDDFPDFGCDVYNFAKNNHYLFDYYWHLNPGLNSVSIDNLDPGTYKVLAFNGYDNAYMSFAINYYSVQSITKIVNPDDEPVGGVRIKSVTDYASDGEFATKKEYEYEGVPVTIDGNEYSGYSSGHIFGEPKYYYTSTYFYEGQISPFESEVPHDYLSNTLNLTSTSRVNLGGVKGTHIGYSRVVERQVDNNGISNGYKVSYYRKNNVQTSGFPFSHPADDFGAGDLLREEYYDASDNLLQSSEYEYSFDIGEDEHRATIHGVKVYTSSSQNNRLLLGEDVDNPGDYFWAFQLNYPSHLYPTMSSTNRKTFNKKMVGTNYRIKTNWQYLSKVTNTQYLSGGPLIVTSQNFYDPINAQVIRFETEDSQGNDLTTKLYYANNDLESQIDANAENGKELMAIKNILNSPLEKIQFKNGNIISAQRTDYTVVGGEVYPKKVYVSNSEAPFLESDLDDQYEKRAEYEYGFQGELINYNKVNDLNEAFVWCSDMTRVIATAANASNIDIAYTSFENDNNEGGWSFRIEEYNQGRTGEKAHNLISNPVTKLVLNSTSEYIVSFWKKGGEPQVTNSVLLENSQTDNNGWKFYKYKITNASSLQISSTSNVYVDELRLYPINAQMTSYVYKDGFGLVSETDMNERTKFYEYFDDGKLKLIKDHEFNMIQSFSYKYKSID
jgi:hypothetical protein